MQEDKSVLEGVIAVRAALLAESRPIECIWIAKQRLDSDVASLERLAALHDVSVRRVDSRMIAEQAEGQTHGGVIAWVGQRRFKAPGDLLLENENSFIVMLDGVEDPFNFGQAVRALYASGCHGVVVRPRNWLSAAGTVGRASAGASEWMPMAVANEPEEAAEFYGSRGLIVAITAEGEGSSIYEVNLAVPLFLLIGGEKRGVSRRLARQAQLHLAIPYGRSFDHSLGAATATAIIAFEIMRQRQDVL